ncbi:hypothetical protein LTR85_010228 [Meristemomyces frigidus]|nr:hypothetical protein LTR85_010228 [Meristemomyces frigidus]
MPTFDKQQAEGLGLASMRVPDNDKHETEAGQYKSDGPIMPSEASKKSSPHFLYVVAYKCPNGVQVYRAYSHSADAKAAALHLWNDKLRLPEAEWGKPVVVEASREDKSIPQATFSLSSDASAYKGSATYMAQHVVVEKVFMDNKDGAELRKIEEKP